MSERGDINNLEDSFVFSLDAMRKRKFELESELPGINLAIAVLEEKLADIRRQQQQQ